MIRSTPFLALAIGALLALATPASAQTQQADPHHPGTQAASPQTNPPAAQQPAAPPAAAPGPGGMMMQGGAMPMMGMMPTMMNMMGQAPSAASDTAMPGMEMADRVEGRIAFLRTELKITDAQESAWHAFAAALRANAQTLGGMRSMMLSQQSGQTSLAARLEQQERWYTARLDGIRALKTAFSPLYAVLDDQQKQTADQIAPPHLGLMPMGGMGSGMMQMGQMPGANP